MRILNRYLVILLCAMVGMGMGGRAWGQTTTTFGLSNSAFTQGGYYATFNPVPSTSDNGFQTSGTANQIDFNFVGTTLTFPKIYVTAATGDVKYILDGGALTAPTLTGTGTRTNEVLVSGLTDNVTHRMTIYFPGTARCIIDSPNFISVTSTATTPSVSQVSGYGTVTQLYANTSHIAIEGAAVSYTSGGMNAYRSSATTSGQVYDDTTLRFKGSFSTLYCWMYGDNENLNLDVYDSTGTTLQNSYQITPYNANAGWGGWGAGFTGLDTTATHIYELSGAGASGWIVQSLMTNGGTGIDLTWAAPTRHYVAGGIDSITRAEAGTSTQSWLGYLRLYARAHGLAVANFGISGAAIDSTLSGQTVIGWSSSASTTTGRYNDLLTFAASHTIDTAFWLGGINDLNGSETSGNFTTATQNWVNALVASSALANTQHYVLGILPTAYGSHTYAQESAFNAIISPIINAAGSHWHYVDTSVWNYAGAAFQSGGAVNNANYFDTLHPIAGVAGTPGTGYQEIFYYVNRAANPSTVLFRRANGTRAGSRSSQ